MTVKTLTGTLCERIASATALAVLLHVLMFAVYVALSSFNLWHPVSALFNLITTIISPKTWLCWTPSAVAACLVGCATLSSVSSSAPKLARSRLDVVASYFSYQAILLLISYVFLATIVPISYLYITGTSFIFPCKTNVQLRCVSDRMVFISSGSVACGVLIALKMSAENFKPLLFNAVINDHLRPTLFRTIKKSAPSCMKLIPVYMVAYYLAAGYISAPYRLFLNAYSEEDASIFNLWAIVGCWLLSTVNCTSVLMMKELLHLHLTQFIEVPIVDLVALLETPISAFEEQLVFQDLAQLARGRSVLPVAEVFALSQPGGLPHSWNNILRHSLRVIYNFQNQLNEFHLMPHGPIEKPNELNSSGPTARASDVHSVGNGLRRLRSVDAPLPAPQQEYFGDFLEPISNQLLAVINKVNCMMPRPLQFFTAPQTDLQICSLLENSQTVMLASTSLSGLSCRALKEDRFGVMVNDLPTIINTLVTLEESVSRIVLPKRKQKSILANTMHNALSVTLKQSIAQIAHAYSTHLDFLRLESPRLNMMKRIVESGQDKELIKATGVARPF